MNAREDHERFPSALQALLIVAGLFAAELLVGAVLFDSRRVLGLGDDGASALITLLGNAVVFVLVMQHKQLGFRALFQPGRQSVAATLLLTSPPIVLLMPMLVLAMSTAVELVAWLFPLSAAERAMFERMASDSLPSLVAACVLAPVLEEMLFRGIFLRSFLQQYERRSAIVLSSALFGLAHLNLYQFVVAFALGLLAGWLYERTRSLWPCIVLHAGYNTSLTLLDSWERQGGAAAGDGGFSTGTWAMSLLAAAAGAWALKRLLVRRAA